MSPSLLEQLKILIKRLRLPFATSLYTDTPLPDTYVVATPLSDGFEVFADGQPDIEIEEVRLALFTRTNYLAVRDQLATALLAAGLTVTGRRYVGFEADTGFHHYVVDVAGHRVVR